MSKLRIQQYMEKHRITPLFEELMNKVLHDQPDDPIVYMIKCLYRKAALPVPKDLKPGTLRRSSPERIARRSKSPEKSSTQAWAVGSGPDLVDRSYDKPWLKHSKKVRNKEEDKPEQPAKGKRQKAGWVSDTKVTATTFDDLFDDEGQQRSDPVGGRTRKEETNSITKAWSKNYGLEDSEDVDFRSRGYRGPRCDRNDEDPLAGEIMLASTETKQETSDVSSKSRGARLEAEKHRQDLERILAESDKMSLDSGYDGWAVEREEEDDAIELLEDPEDLRREGVTNISPSGYKISRILRQRQEEANVKLNINFQSPVVNSARGMEGYSDEGSQYGDFYEQDLDRPPTGMSYRSNMYSEGNSPVVSDDEFESVSQVVGPRKPVWAVPDSDGETYRQDNLTRSLPPQPRPPTYGRFSSSGPVRFEPSQSVEENIFMEGSKTWAPGQGQQSEESPPNIRDSVRSSRSHDGGGWNIPDDTEVSVTTAWTGNTSGIAPKGPPKAY